MLLHAGTVKDMQHVFLCVRVCVRARVCERECACICMLKSASVCCQCLHILPKEEKNRKPTSTHFCAKQNQYKNLTGVKMPSTQLIKLLKGLFVSAHI